MSDVQNLELVLAKSDVDAESALSLKTAFAPLFEQAEQWQQKAAGLVVTDVSQVVEMKLARESRLALKAIRVEAEKTRKRLKEDSLRRGKAIDGVYNVLEYLIVPIETHLLDQEEFAARAEAKRKAELVEQRSAALRDLGVNPLLYRLDDMMPEDFQKLLNDTVSAINAQREAAARAEKERIEREAHEAEERRLAAARAEHEREQARIRNEALAREREALQKALDAERAAAEAERKRFEEAARVAQAEKEEAARQLRAAQLAEANRIAEAQRIEAARVAAEREAAERALAAPDKEKLIALRAQVVALGDFVPALRSVKGLYHRVRINSALSALNSSIDAAIASL